MSNALQARNTSAFFAQAAASFVIAVAAVGLGVAYLPVDRWIRGFLAIGMLFLVSSAFTLAKVVRDQQESASALEVARLNMMMAQRDRAGSSSYAA